MTCDAYFRTWLSYSSQKSCVKIWFGLVEPFKSYRVHKHPPPPKKKNQMQLKTTCFLWAHSKIDILKYKNNTVAFTKSGLKSLLAEVEGEGWRRRLCLVFCSRLSLVLCRFSLERRGV